MKKIIPLLLIAVLMFAIVGCGNNKPEPVESTANNAEGEETEEPSSDVPEDTDSDVAEEVEFSLFANGNTLAEIQVGECYRNTGRYDALIVSFPENYTMKSGSLYHFDENDEKQTTQVEGVLSDLLDEKKINLTDKVLARFYIGTGDFDPMFPSSGDTIYQVTVYSDWREPSDPEYVTSYNGLDFYASTGDAITDPPCTYKQVDIPVIDKVNNVGYYVMIRCITAPGIDNVTLQEFTDAIAQHVRAIAPTETEEEGTNGEEESPISDDVQASPGSDDEFRVPTIYNGTNITDDIIGALTDDGWYPTYAIAHTVDFENTKYHGATFEIRFVDQIVQDMGDGKIGQVGDIEGIDVSEIEGIRFKPNPFMDDTEHPTFEVLGISSEMECEDVIKVLNTLELEDPESLLNWDNIGDDRSGESQRFDVIVDEHSYDINIEYTSGKVTTIKTFKRK